MFNKGIWKIIGYGIAWVLTIWWATVVITNDDIAQQYKNNTWKELSIDEMELVSFEEYLKAETEERNNMQSLYDEINCDEYEEYDTCLALKDSLKEVIAWYDGSIECDTRIIEKQNLEKSDIAFCVNSETQLRDSVKNFYITIDWYCNEECEEELEAYEYNIAMFQSYQNKLN